MPVVFCEKLQLKDLINFGLRGQKVFYGFPSLTALLALRLFGNSKLFSNLTKIDLGDVNSISGVRRNAYKNAERCVNSLHCKQWANRVAEDLDFDFFLLVQKYFFDKFYQSFLFIELAFKFAQENPDKVNVIFVFSDEVITLYEEKLRSKFVINHRSIFLLPRFLVFALLLPLFAHLLGFIKKNKCDLKVDNKIICEIDSTTTYEMFKTLFHNIPDRELLFVAERSRVAEIEDSRNIHILGLDAKRRREVFKSSWLFSLRCLQYVKQVYRLSNDLIWIFYYYICGMATAINGQHNVYCSFGHLETIKAVRNELLRSSGNKTVFVPMNSYVTNQFYPSEFMLNYDVALTPGKHFEDLYPRKRAKTKTYLPTGSYASHRMLLPDNNRIARQSELKNFKKDDTLILFTSPGICPPTLNIEIKLMSLLRSLSHLDGIKVILRLKPVEPSPKFKEFYQQQLNGVNDVLITAGEYDLFDFVGIADLVVTSMSTSAYDLAQTGLPAMFIDYHYDAPDTEYLPDWLRLEGFPLTEELARDAIVGWVKDHNFTRQKWAEKMRGFVKYFAHRHPDFETYQQCVQNYIGEIRAELASDERSL